MSLRFRKIDRYQDQLDSSLLCVKYTKSKGRHIVAVKDIPAGTQLFSEYPLVYVIKTDHSDIFCNYCACPCNSASATSCATCNNYWCCLECKSDDLYHRNDCHLQDSLVRFSRWNSVDLDLLRISSRMLLLKQIDKTSIKRACNTATVMPDDALEDMVSNMKSIRHDWLHSVREAGADLMHILPALNDPETFVNYAARVNFNAHAISDNYGTKGIIGLGMFPMCALINHSCFPNTNFYSDTSQNDVPRLTIRTLVDIKCGEEITLTYIDVMQSKDMRQDSLLTGKYFICDCVRCSRLSPNDPDSFLCGFKCSNCGRGVYEVNSLKSSEHWQCFECNDEIKASEIQSLSDNLEHDYQSASEWFISNPPRMDFAVKSFEVLLEKYCGEDKRLVAHDLNWHIFNSRLALLTAYNSVGYATKAIECCRNIVEALKLSRKLKIIPYNSADLASQMFCLCEMEYLYSKLTGNYELLGDKTIERIRECQDMRQMLYGSDHPRTIEANDLYNKILAFHY